MIRDAVIHMLNDQPLLADLEQMPMASDACLVCTNLRTIDGKKPTYTDQLDSWFLIPLGMIRFIEVPRGAAEEGSRSLVPIRTPLIRDEPDGYGMESDPEVLRRIREA